MRKGKRLNYLLGKHAAPFAAPFRPLCTFDLIKVSTETSIAKLFFYKNKTNKPDGSLLPIREQTGSSEEHQRPSTPDWPIRLPLLPSLPSSLHVLSVPNKGSDAQMAAPWAC